MPSNKLADTNVYFELGLDLAESSKETTAYGGTSKTNKDQKVEKVFR